MRIALCDDSEKDLQRIYEMTKEYFTARGDIQAVLECFKSSDELMEHTDYDIYILDILLGEKSGINLAKMIRERTGLKSEIIFTTSSRDFALDAFSVNAKQYLLKPVGREQLCQAMDQIINYASKKKAHAVIQVKTADGIEELNADEVICVEYTARIMKFRMKSEKIVNSIYIRSSFEKNLELLLKQPNFIQTHKSFVINMDCVQRYSQSEILMCNGMFIPVSRSNAAEVKHKYMGYISSNMPDEGTR